MTSYTSIDCGIHDHLELTAMRGVRVEVDFVDAEGTPQVLSDVRLETIRAQGGAEFGVFKGDDGAITEIRLDRLDTVQIPGGRLEIRGARTLGAPVSSGPA